MLLKRISALLLMFLFTGILVAQKKQQVVLLKVFEEISPSTARYVSKGVRYAEEKDADLILVHMNTYGGLADFADSIRANLLDTPIPTAVFIDKNAASAGAIISIACDSIYMAPGASIGAATVVDGTTGMALPDKYQSYWRGIIRSTAEKNGRDPRIAEKMVDQSLTLEGVSDSGRVITFTPSEAIEHGYCEGEKQDIADVLKTLDMEGAEVETFEKTKMDFVMGFLLNPAVSGILIMFIIGGIFWEMKTPGVGFPLIVSIIATALFFAPHYIEGLAQNWEIGLFLLGVGLIAVEIFVTPGFGVPGISGIILTVTSLAIALVRNQGLDFSMVTLITMLRSFAFVLLALICAIILVLVIVKRLYDKKSAYPFIDHDTQDKEKGYTSLDATFTEYLEKEGTALTDLRPAGFINIEGHRLDAASEGPFISKGTKVKVIDVRENKLIVAEI